MLKPEITIIGAAIMDVLAGPVTPQIFAAYSTPMNSVKIAFGGDALNESVALSRMGRTVDLISKIGCDEAGDRVQEYLKSAGVETAHIKREAGLETGVNIVLVDDQGERRFLSNPKGSLRALSEADVEAYLDTAADLVSFASMFVSPQLDVPAMERIFRRVKDSGRTLAVDMTNPKRGETLKDVRGLLPYVDYFFPNREEIARLTGEKDAEKNAQILIEEGVSCAVVKCGGEGCLIRTKTEQFKIPAYPVQTVVDTTGAGDCFAAGFLWGLLEGFSLEECGRFACATASCTVEQLGATTAIRSIEEPMRRYRAHPANLVMPK